MFPEVGAEEGSRICSVYEVLHVWLRTFSLSMCTAANSLLSRAVTSAACSFVIRCRAFVDFFAACFALTWRVSFETALDLDRLFRCFDIGGLGQCWRLCKVRRCSKHRMYYGD